MTDLANLKNLERAQLRDGMEALGEKRFRGDQVFRWVWRRRVESIEDMTDLSFALRERLAESRIPRLEPADVRVAQDGTTKLLIALEDGKQVESVIIPDKDRRTLCVSTQVGCAMGCTFCRTATMGLIRHLQPWEIVEQVLIAERVLAERGEGRTIQLKGRGQAGKVERRLTNLVFMGMGEPLHNHEGTAAACRILTDTQGIGFPPRRITVSTVGLADRIEPFLAETGVNLAISLNAPDDAIRSEIMPVNRKFDMDLLLQTVANLELLRRQRVTFEYVLLAGLNDGVDQARTLAQRVVPVADRIKINLIPFNPHEGADYGRPHMEDVEAFRETLLAGGVEKVHVRRPRGDRILAACGQLALEKKG